MRDMPTVKVTNPLQEKAMQVVAFCRENSLSSTDLRAFDVDEVEFLLADIGVVPDGRGQTATRIVEVAAHLWQTDGETAALALVAAERRMAPRGECPACDRERAFGNLHFPAHAASTNCRSGSRNHCTCDACW